MTTGHWSDEDKAYWILENGIPHIKWIMERDGDKLYQRISLISKNVPPWIHKERKLIKKLNKQTGCFESIGDIDDA